MFLEKLSAPCGVLTMGTLFAAPMSMPYLRKKPEDRGLPHVGALWVQPENTTTQSQEEDQFWRWVSLNNFTVRELKEL
ncbi:Hypothetical protein PHPALM_17309 [Phytophthora palmivora]|uniref:ATP-binding cassette (ABC) Superfamily n=1 Tax=Phytophthora palmivora TaxID=4796 RepID=A0A2P4XMP9_9STRA|nr:Hypothetical protein PHPALM_17309 [Phytophthora palmivora]